MGNISNDIAEKEYGVITNHDRMETGQLRFRLQFNDGSSFIRGMMCDNYGWENSHYHKVIKEIYCIQKGEIIFVYYKDNQAIFNKLKAGDVFVCEPNLPHNVYNFKGTVLMVTKIGQCEHVDWNGFKALDDLVKHVNEEDFKAMNL